MKKSLIIAVFMNSIIATAALAELVTFTCYDPLIRKRGGYDMNAQTGYVTTELTFDTTLETVTMINGFVWNCTTVSWSDPLIFFVCQYDVPNSGLSLASNVFDRKTLRWTMEAVTPNSVVSYYTDDELDERRTRRVNHDYDECERKGF